MTTQSYRRTRAGTRWFSEKARLPLFYAITLLFVAFLLFAIQEPLQFTVSAWMAGYEAPTHRVHHIMIGGLLGLLVIGVASQLYQPGKRVGGYILAALVIVVTMAMSLIGGGIIAVQELLVFLIPLIIVGALHPTLRSVRFDRESVDRRMLGLAVIAAVPMIAFAALQMNLHLTLTDDHVAFEHYIMMASGAVVIGLGALIASFRPAGWRILAYGVVALAALIGIASIAFPDAVQGTNFGIIGGTLVVLWAVSYLAVAEYGARSTTGGAETTVKA